MKLKGRNKISPEFSMSSMTDIVFLLLIFFLLTSNSPNALDLILPKAKGKTTNTQQVSVSIDTDLRYFLNEKLVNYISWSGGKYFEDAVPKNRDFSSVLCFRTVFPLYFLTRAIGCPK